MEIYNRSEGRIIKKVVSGIELQEKMKEAIDLLCDTVKKTLGPKGNNVIINHSSFSPFITNDGVTIAQNIESEDEVLSAILEIAKESSIKTNEVVGDGTTTTLVLLQALFEGSMHFIKQGVSPIALKRELQQSLNGFLPFLKKMSLSPTEEMLHSIACVSSNEEELGSLVSSVFKKVKHKAAITIEESTQNHLEVSFEKGYTFPIQLASFYFLKDKKQVIYTNSSVLLVNDTLRDIELISEILNEVIENRKSFIIIANGYEEYFVNEMVSFSLSQSLDICLIKIEEYGSKQRAILKDLEVLTHATIAESESEITGRCLGKGIQFVIDKETARLDFTCDEKIRDYIKQIRDEQKACTEDFMQEFYQKREAMFTTGVAKISVGATTKTECRERRMRLEDAICAVSVSKNGVLPGGGLALLKVAEQINPVSDSLKIWKEALIKPFEQILYNAGVDYQNVLEKIKEKDYTILYNVVLNQYEDLFTTHILDPLDVVIHSLENACSIAGMLLTTSSLIINEYSNHLNKLNDYSEVI